LKRSHPHKTGDICSAFLYVWKKKDEAGDKVGKYFSVVDVDSVSCLFTEPV
jgi:hypothetical protein